jgi:hypothetical protein
MSGGFKEVVFNTLEEVISPDLNRSQKFKGADVAEMMRYMLDVSGGTNDLDSGGVTTEYVSGESPLRAEILNGFMVKPALADTRFSVDPGVLFAVDPDGAPDDSNYKYVCDVGSLLSGANVIGANSSGQDRVDIIGAVVNFTTIETDSRNLFNPVTGLFTPAAIAKANQATLTYSVVVGTPGSGLPAVPVGFLPLCVAYVPNGSTNNDAVSFYDVRPLINDRAYGVSNVGSYTSYLVRGDYYVDTQSQAGHAWLSGTIEAVLNGRRVGGVLQTGSPTAPQPGVIGAQGLAQIYGVDLSLTTNAEPGFSSPTSANAFLYLAFPGGLPRWARYTGAYTGVRKPSGPRGILVLSNKVPQGPISLAPPSAISVPGFNAATLNAVCFGMVAYNSSAQPAGSMMSDRVVWTDSNVQLPFVSIVGSSLSQVATFRIPLGTSIVPGNVRAIRIQLFCTMTNVSGSLQNGNIVRDLIVQDNSANFRLLHINDGNLQLALPTSSTVQFSWEVEIPIPYLVTPGNTAIPNGVSFLAWNISANYGGAAQPGVFTVGSFAAFIKGYRLA